MIQALALLLPAVLAYAPLQNGVTVDADPKDAEVVLRGDEVHRPKQHRDFKGDSGSREIDEWALYSKDGPSYCTYAGLVLSCTPPEAAAPQGTVFTPGLARQAVASIPLPGLTLNVQPDGETLVAVPTIFWADAQPFETSIDLLGHSIDVEATPESFTWIHGDGTMQTTEHPGKPFPDADITHKYWQPADLEARVDTAYSVRFSIDGGGWTDLGETLVAAGPGTAIDVHEAAPVLVR